MSAGEYVVVRYETRISWVVKATVQPETLLLTLGGQANSPSPLNLYAGLPSAIMSGGRQRIGIHARQLRLRLAEGQSPPPGYAGPSVTVPILRRSLWDLSTVGATVTYLGRDWVVVGRIAEQIN